MRRSLLEVLVASVQPSSFSEEIGLEPGDVIVEMNHQPVRTVQDLMKVQGSLKSGRDQHPAVAVRSFPEADKAACVTLAIRCPPKWRKSKFALASLAFSKLLNKIKLQSDPPRLPKFGLTTQSSGA